MTMNRGKRTHIHGNSERSMPQAHPLPTQKHHQPRNTCATHGHEPVLYTQHRPGLPAVGTKRPASRLISKREDPSEVFVGKQITRDNFFASTLTVAPSTVRGVHSAGEHLGHRATYTDCPSCRVSRVPEQVGQVGRALGGGRLALECSLT